MPELPEVETMRRGIAAIIGSRIEGVRRPRSRLRPIQIRPTLGRLRRRVTGRTITGLGRVGKRVVAELEGGDRLVFEPRMTGRILLAEPPDCRHLRLVFELSGGAVRQMLFWDVRGLGVVQVLSPDEFARQCGPHRLGPDALEISADALRQRLAHGRRAIKVALLDQRALLGVGNLYASEILHRAGVHPAMPCCRLKPFQWQKIHARMREVLEEAVRQQGSTLADGNYRNAQNEAGGFQEHHRAYQRAGQPCLQCGRAAIERIVQAQRSTFFCPVCQPARP